MPPNTDGELVARGPSIFAGYLKGPEGNKRIFVQSVVGAVLDSEEIKAFLQDQGASRLLVPERFEFVVALPMTQAGKHDKKALREELRRRLGRP